MGSRQSRFMPACTPPNWGCRVWARWDTTFLGEVPVGGRRQAPACGRDRPLWEAQSFRCKREGWMR
jgi:hypothetical protein